MELSFSEPNAVEKNPFTFTSADKSEEDEEEVDSDIEEENLQETIVASTDVQGNRFSSAELETIQATIEQMNKFNQIEVLRILHSYPEVILNENKNGIYVNLSEVKDEIIEKLNAFIQYVTCQEKNLVEIEQQKESFKKNYFGKI